MSPHCHYTTLKHQIHKLLFHNETLQLLCSQEVLYNTQTPYNTQRLHYTCRCMNCYVVRTCCTILGHLITHRDYIIHVVIFCCLLNHNYTEYLKTFHIFISTRYFRKLIGTVVVVWQLHLEIPIYMQSVSITTKVVSSNG